ncbi:hypothetical protein E8E12_000344 [Didymella heteroderae]|uniref:F-box domain-containing protein n=1 Tax=Didymella heteroderae TaxID=1769908 RepID=A0A9P5C2G1_9PLEO|nr:hypothetical protein E8E12_000344 [Didymella heteroderae]
MSLSTLPTELLEQIASYLDLAAFRSLRLTAHHCHIRTSLFFKHRFFSTQYVSWNKDSLKRLVYVAAHAEFGDALKCLVVDATPYYALELWKMRRRSADAGHLTPITDDEDGSKLVRRLEDEYEVRAQEADSTARWFNETRFDVVCLKKVFARVKSLENLVFAYEGMDMRYSKFAQMYCETTQHEMSRPFVSALHALAASGTPVNCVSTAGIRSHGAVSVGRLESLAPCLRAFDNVFEKLDTLRLKLRDWRSPDTGFELERSRAPFSARFLVKCRNVRVIDLSFYSCFEDDAFGELVRVGRFERLQSVTLEMFRVKQGKNLIEFLEPSKAFLTELRLRHVLLDTNDEKESGRKCWNEVFGEFTDEKRHLQNLRVFHAERLFFNSRIGVP